MNLTQRKDIEALENRIAQLEGQLEKKEPTDDLVE